VVFFDGYLYLLCFNQLIFNSIHHKTSGVFIVGFAQNIGPVFFDGAFADK